MPNRLTLTLDNGPDPIQTPRVLDILATRRICAVFFVIGQSILAPGGRETLDKIVQGGHRVGNHTMTHGVPLGFRSDADAVAEIADAEAVIGEHGSTPPLFRPNGGGELGPHLFSAAALDYLRAHRYTAVTWNSVPRDWEEPAGAWVSRALQAIEQLDHTMLVHHDVLPATVDRLAGFLDALIDRRAEFTDEFPTDCVVMLRGQPKPALSALSGRSRRPPCATGRFDVDAAE
jgi:peptidoglycan-N-acetylglucosamine deacetylase